MDLQVLAPGPELGPLATHPHWEAMYDEVARLIGEHRTTLVFTLSRRPPSGSRSICRSGSAPMR